MTNLPPHYQRFNIQFGDGNTASAVRLRPEGNPVEAVKLFGLQIPRPIIFISGGAGGMSDKDRKMVEGMIDAVAQFAHDKNAIIIDGGTESGVMQMVGNARQKANHSFPLIGVSPLGKVSFPGYKNPGEEATLEDSHTHFILVDGNEWGAESEMILKMAFAICQNGKLPAVGVLINGGRIALHEVYLATTHEHPMSMIVLEGSGRTADEISTAFRTGKTNRKILEAILKGGDLTLVGTIEGSDVMRQRLEEKFKQQMKA